MSFRTWKSGKLRRSSELCRRRSATSNIVITQDVDLKKRWTRGHWRTHSLLDQRIATQVTSKVHVFSDSVLCLGGKCQEHPEAAKTWENDTIRELVRSPEFLTMLRHRRKTIGIRPEDLPGGSVALDLWAPSKTRNGLFLGPPFRLQWRLWEVWAP